MIVAVPVGSGSTPVYGFQFSEITIPNFAALGPYVYNNHGAAYPAYDFAGKYAGDLVYIDTSSRMDWFNPYNSTTGSISAPLTLLYQTTPAGSGPADQIDNEFMLDTPYGTALLYGNLTTSAGALTVETVDLSNGTISQVTTPVLFENNVQADYIGNGRVVVFNATGVGGQPTYIVNMYNHTSWRAGLSVGIAAGNIYWVSQVASFFDVQGQMVTQYAVQGNSLVQVARVWFNNSAVSSTAAVNGVVYDTSTGQLAFWESTNAGWYFLVGALSPNGLLTRSGSYAYFNSYVPYVEHYCYTSTYVWAVATTPYSLTGPTVLFSPFNNTTLPAPNVVTRLYGSGGWSNFLLENPFSTAQTLSLNYSLVGAASLSLGQFVWAWQPTPPAAAGGSAPGSATGWPQALSQAFQYAINEWYVWVLLVAIAVVIWSASRRR